MAMMAEAAAEQTIGRNLQDIFLDGWNIFEDIENTNLPFNSPEYQEKVKKCMELFEDSTRIVSLVGMFSSNELLDEVATEHLQYILLPFFLGQLSTKIAGLERDKVLEIAEVYYKDYLKRCEEYEIYKVPRESQLQSANESASVKDELTELIHMATTRNDKIIQFRKKKELEEQLKKMKAAVRNPNVDDETKRDFFIKYISKSIIESKDELCTIDLEKKMVGMRKHLATEGPPKPHQHQHCKEKRRNEPLKPIIITRDDAQKSVFGLGYPSLPVLTVRDFYEQRVQEGIFPNAEQVVEMNKKMLEAQTEDPAEKEDVEKVEKEILIENDDPDYIQSLRAKDEYKDNVRRGDGNRHNRS